MPLYIKTLLDIGFMTYLQGLFYRYEVNEPYEEFRSRLILIYGYDWPNINELD